MYHPRLACPNFPFLKDHSCYSRQGPEFAERAGALYSLENRHAQPVLCIGKKSKETDVWVLRYRETQQNPKSAHRSIIVGTVDQYSTKTKAQNAAEALSLTHNNDYMPIGAITVETLVDRYILEAMPERYFTSQRHKSYLNGYIKAQWGDHDLATLRQSPFWVEKWLRELDNAPKTKAPLRASCTGYMSTR